MENLPVFKTAWAANKQMLKMIFSIKGFFGFVLPFLLLQAVLSYLDLSQSFEQVMVIDEGSLEGDVRAEVSNQLGMLVMLLPLLLANVFFSILMAVRWHRRMILDQEVGLSPKGLGSVMWTFLKKTVLISLFTVLTVGVLMAIVGFSIDQIQLTEWPVMYGYIAAAVFSFLISIYLGFKIIPPFYMVLPASAVDVSLTFSEALTLVKPVSGRLVLTLLLSAVMLILPVSILATMVAVPLIATEQLYAASILLGAISVISVFPTIGVLSMFFMHYVLPNMQEYEVEEVIDHTKDESDL